MGDRFTRDGDRWLFDGKRYKDLTYEEYLEMVGCEENTLPYSNLDKAMPFFAGKWNLTVHAAVLTIGPCGFNALRRALPHLSSSVLASTLRYLASIGMVRREVTDGTPPHTIYSATKRAYDFMRVFYEMAKWIDRAEE